MTEGDRELVMFYNVENFFSPDPAPVHKLDPTNSGLRNWDERKFNNKMFKVAHVFQLVQEAQGILPMLIGVSEVQGQKVLDQLAQMEPLNGNYGVVHYESMDERGVDVALLFDKSKLELISSEPISFVFEIDDKDPENYDTTRDVLLSKFRYKGQLISVFVFHLPSKREGDVNKPKRDYIIKTVKERIEELIANGEAVLLCGDFNENPDDENLQKLLYDEKFNKILSNPFEELYKNQVFSTFHFKDGLLFDQIILSNQFFDADFPLNLESAVVFNSEKLSNWDRKFQGRPFRTYAGTRYLGGYSDHFPVFIKLKNKT